MKRILVSLCLVPVLALAQSYPTKPVRIVLPFGPGGIADITTRTIAPKLGEGLGQQVLVENLPGAGGIRAAETVARADSDGHTLLLLTNGNAVSQALFKSLPYDPVNDFAMISTVGFFSMVIVTRPESPAKTLQDAIAMAKANPGKMNIGTITPGGTQHLAGELFRSTAGIDALVVPHKTTGEVIVAARNGNVDLAVDFIAPLLSSIKSGALRPLAVTAGKRFPGLPDVPIVRVVADNLTQYMTEYVVWRVLDHHRQGALYRTQKTKKIWHEPSQRPANDVSVGIMGFGELGSGVAKVLLALSYKVNGWSRRLKTMAGVTSFQVVAQIRRVLRVPKVGHGGTLDPMATGVLPILLGEATKLTPYLQAEDKEYLATARLGVTISSVQKYMSRALVACYQIAYA